MHCPFCHAQDTKVIDTRIVSDGAQVKRRRECLTCHERFTTFEQAELIMPRVVKSDGSRQSFSEDKLRNGMMRALEKRPVSTQKIDNAINHIKSLLRAKGEREVTSSVIGDMVIAELMQLDPVAYIRFASVYLSFQNMTDFVDVVNKLSQGQKKTRADMENT